MKRHTKKSKLDQHATNTEQASETKPLIRKLRSRTQPKKEDLEKSPFRPPKRVRRAKKVKKNEWPYKGYDEKEFALYESFMIEARDLAVNELKEILKKNDQKCSGTKLELMERYADGKTLGSIPRCISCGGGRLRFDYKTGTYSCPGYMEDINFVYCKKKYDISFIKRKPWI